MKRYRRALVDFDNRCDCVDLALPPRRACRRKPAPARCAARWWILRGARCERSRTGDDGRGTNLTATTNEVGVYELKDLAPGAYTVEVTAKGFAPYKKEAVQIVAGQAQQLNITLAIAKRTGASDGVGRSLSLDTTASEQRRAQWC